MQQGSCLIFLKIILRNFYKEKNYWKNTVISKKQYFERIIDINQEYLLYRILI